MKKKSRRGQVWLGQLHSASSLKLTLGNVLCFMSISQFVSEILAFKFLRRLVWCDYVGATQIFPETRKLLLAINPLTQRLALTSARLTITERVGAWVRTKGPICVGARRIQLVWKIRLVFKRRYLKNGASYRHDSKSILKARFSHFR